MKTLQYKDKEGKWHSLPIVQAGATLPEDGEVGQVLTKTEDGVEWKNASSSAEDKNTNERALSGTSGYLNSNNGIKIDPSAIVMTDTEDIYKQPGYYTIISFCSETENNFGAVLIEGTGGKTNRSTDYSIRVKWLSKEISGLKVYLNNNSLNTFTFVPEVYIKNESVTKVYYSIVNFMTDPLLGGVFPGGMSYIIPPEAKEVTDRYALLSDLDNDIDGVNTTTNVSSIPTSKKLCIVNTSESNSLGFAEQIPTGQELHVIINNTGSDKITIAIPITFKANGLDNLEIEAGNYGEVNVISDGTNLYLRAL